MVTAVNVRRVHHYCGVVGVNRALNFALDVVVFVRARAKISVALNRSEADLIEFAPQTAT